MKRRFLLIGAGVAFTTVGLAASARADTPGDKLGRGVSNLALGIVEVPAEMSEEGKRGGPLYAMSIGFAEGMGGFVTRELVGVYEVVTFPAPVPRGYRPILWPEYPWQLVE